MEVKEQNEEVIDSYLETKIQTKPVLNMLKQTKQVQVMIKEGSYDDYIPQLYPCSYMTCIKNIRGSFLGLNPNSPSSFLFYQKCIKQMIQTNKQLAQSLSNQQKSNDTQRNRLSLRKPFDRNVQTLQIEKKQIDKKKRNRRKARQILKLYRCSVIGCDKTYGSDGALAHHMNDKHFELSEFQMEPIRLQSTAYSNKDKLIEVMEKEEGETDKLQIQRAEGQPMIVEQ